MVLVAVLVLLTACAPKTVVVGGVARGEVGHVHDLGVDAGDGHLFVAAQDGIFRLGSRGLQRVGARQDTIGLAVIGPHQFLASGHSVGGTETAVGLGLIESLDGARSWRQIPRSAGADFHVLSQGPRRLYGYDARTETLAFTTDRRQGWTPLLRTVVRDLAPAPTWGDDRVVAATKSGTVLLQSGQTIALPSSPVFQVVGWPTTSMLVGVTSSGKVYRSGDDGQTWRRVGAVRGVVEAMDTTTVNWYLATSKGIFSSVDHGASWVELA